MAFDPVKRVGVVHVGTATTVATLDELAVSVWACEALAGGATTQGGTQYTPITGTATSSSVQFTGTPAAPNDALTFHSQLTADTVLLVVYSRPGDLPA